MDVVRHQYIGVEAEPNLFFVVLDPLEVDMPVLVVPEDVPLLIAPSEDMVESAGKFDAKRSCHGLSSYQKEMHICNPDPSF